MITVDPVSLALLGLACFLAGLAFSVRPPPPRPIEHVRAARECLRTIDHAVAESRAATARAHRAYLNATRATFPPAGRRARFVRRVAP